MEYPIVFTNKKYLNKVCLEPFGTIELDVIGNIRLCGCANWMPTVVGNIFENSIDEILNSELAISIRNSIRDGSYRYCNENTCGLITNNRLLELKDSNDLDPKWKLYHNESASKIIKTYFISGDLTCNLSCPSCRTTVIKNSTDDIKLYESLVDKLNNNLLGPGSDEIFEIRMSTSGEVFASPLLFNFLVKFPLERHPNVRFWFQTNGLLVKRRWEKVARLSKNIHNITVTADSCSKDVYEKLRRGGIFEDLVENLNFISELGIEFNLRMVVQRDNQHEITKFYEWSKSFGATAVEYTRITNWGTYSAKEFIDIDVLNQNHKLYQNTAQQLADLKNNHGDVTFLGFGL